jgi:hypothetical protein
LDKLLAMPVTKTIHQTPNFDFFSRSLHLMKVTVSVYFSVAHHLDPESRLDLENNVFIILADYSARFIDKFAGSCLPCASMADVVSTLSVLVRVRPTDAWTLVKVARMVPDSTAVLTATATSIGRIRNFQESSIGSCMFLTDILLLFLYSSKFHPLGNGCSLTK